MGEAKVSETVEADSARTWKPLTSRTRKSRVPGRRNDSVTG